MTDPYEVLGVDRTVSHAEIRKAYVRLARDHHPDAHAGEGAQAVARAERRMRELNEAWSMLRDPATRDQHDRDRGIVAPPAPDVTRPAGKATWTPLADDTGWMDDFDAWKEGDGDFVPPERPRSSSRQLVTMLPVAVFAAAVVLGSVGMVMQLRALLAVAFVGVMASVFLFLAVTLLELRSGRSR